MKMQFISNNGYRKPRQITKSVTIFPYKSNLIQREELLEKHRINSQPPKEPEPLNLENSKLRWGPSTWYLFHTLSEKIKPEHFMNIRNELLDIIKSICLNLPCPSCAQHATEYMKNINYNSIKNKEDLKLFFLNFHNFVNERNKKPLFTLIELNDKYSKAKTINIIKNFISVFQYKNKGFNMIANEMQRQRQVEIYKTWFNNNIYSFEE